MSRVEITREGVVAAIAEFDLLGRTVFLERYGFNGVRDYYVLYDGSRYDSKAIAAVAHKWAPSGSGRALTALELSGGRADAVRRLRELGFEVTEPVQGGDAGATLRRSSAFQAAWTRFARNVAALQKEEPFTGFGEGVAAAWEGYKSRLRTRALEILSPGNWTQAMVGSGEILDRTIAAVEIQEDRVNLINNLVFWQNRYGHANRDHRGLLEAVGTPVRLEVEQALFDLLVRMTTAAPSRVWWSSPGLGIRCSPTSSF